MSEAICHPKWCTLVKGPSNSKCFGPCLNYDKPNPLKYPMCDWYCKNVNCYNPDEDYMELYEELRNHLGCRDQAIRFLKRIDNLISKFNPEGFPEHLLPKAYKIREKLNGSLIHNSTISLQYDSGLISSDWQIFNIFMADENGKRLPCS